MPQGTPWEYDEIVEEMPDFSDVRAAGSTNARERETARQLFAGGGFYSVPPVQTEHFDPSTPEGALNLGMATSVGTAGLGAVAPALGAFLASPAGGGITGAIPGVIKGDPWTAAKGFAYGTAAGGVGGKLIPFLLRLRSAAPAATAAAEAAAAPSVPAFATSTGSMAPQAMIPSVTFSAPAAAAARVPSSVVPFAAAPAAVAAETAAVAPAAAARIAAAEAATVPAAANVATAAAPRVAGPVSTTRLSPEQLAEYRAGIEPVQIFEKGASAETQKLLQLAKESGADFGEKVWFVIKEGVPKIVSSAQAGAAKRAGQVTTWVSNVLGGAPAAGSLAAPAAAAAPIAAATRDPAAAITAKVLPDVAKQIGNRLRQIAETSAANKKIVLEAIKTEYQQAGFPSAEVMANYVFGQRTRI